MPSSKRKYKKYKWEKWRDLYRLKNYVVLDTETTGLSYETEEIIEIAIAKVCDGELVDEFSSLVNPGKKLSAGITKITGITNSDLTCAPNFREIAQQVVDFIGTSIILAHNASFDLNFLCSALDKCKISYNLECIDTVQVAKKAYPEFENHKLETLIHKLGLADRQTHRAMDDVRCTLKLFQGICEKYDNPLAEAISSCCSPISEYHITVREAPLKDLRIALIGTFTFPYSAAKKLISAAGGLVVNANAPDADYLVCGYIDPLEYPLERERLLNLTSEPRDAGSKPAFINEVALLKLCGVSFYGYTMNHSTQAELSLGKKHPFFMKKIVFIGVLNTLLRHEACELVKHVGGSVDGTVSEKTDYLVVGEQDHSLLGDDGMSMKEKKAFLLNQQGTAKIKIIDENEFLALLHST